MPRVGATPISTSPLRIATDPELPSPAPAGRDHAAESATPLCARKAAGSAGSAGTVGLRLGRLPAFSATGFDRLQAAGRAGAASSVEESYTLCLSMLTHSRGLDRLPPQKAMKPADAAHQLSQLCKRTGEALDRLEDLQTAGNLDRAKVADCRRDMLDLNAQLRDAMAGLSTLDGAALLDDDHSNASVKTSMGYLCGPHYARLEEGIARLHTQTARAQLEAYPEARDGTLLAAGRQAPGLVLSDAVAQITTLAISARDGMYYADQHIDAAKLRARLERGDFAASPGNAAVAGEQLALWGQAHAQYGGTMPPNTLPGAYAHLASPPTPGDDR